MKLCLCILGMILLITLAICFMALIIVGTIEVVLSMIYNIRNMIRQGKEKDKF